MQREVRTGKKRSLPSRELSGPSEDVVEQTVRQVKGDSSGSDVSSVHSSSRDSLVELHELLSLFETPEEGSETSDVHDVAAEKQRKEKRLSSGKGKETRGGTRTEENGSRWYKMEGGKRKDVREDGHQMVLDSSDFGVEGSDPLGSLGDLNVKELLDG
jgi:hypothetical protein